MPRSVALDDDDADDVDDDDDYSSVDDAAPFHVADIPTIEYSVIPSCSAMNTSRCRDGTFRSYTDYYGCKNWKAKKQNELSNRIRIETNDN